MRMLAAVLMMLVRVYQWTLRPFIGAHCRFEPSCSHYAIDALRLHGPFRGTALATRRVFRCNPWIEGGWDPCPCRAPSVASPPARQGPAPYADTRMDLI